MCVSLTGEEKEEQQQWRITEYLDNWTAQNDGKKMVKNKQRKNVLTIVSFLL